MKTNQIIRIIIPLVLLLGAATTFFVAVLGNQQANTSAEDIQKANTTTSSFIMYLYVEGIPGEVIEQDHEEWIEVLAYSHNIQTPYNVGTGQTAGSVENAPLRITKMVDKASPKLYQACYTGSVKPLVELDFCMTNTAQDVFYNIELENAKIVSVQDFGVLSGDYPTETVSFTYERFKWTYIEYDAQGQPKGPIESGWIYWSDETPI
ncbi:MAG: Hcp family type VI secretion system effector [Promethearchaeota archaeon]